MALDTNLFCEGIFALTFAVIGYDYYSSYIKPKKKNELSKKINNDFYDKNKNNFGMLSLNEFESMNY